MESNKTGILLVHLGTPVAPTAKAVRDFLRVFLSDPFVIRTPKIFWWPILHGLILRTRPARVAKLYQKIWMKEGSPLRVYAERQRVALQKIVGEKQVRIAMRYGYPSIKESLEAFKQQGMSSVIVLPLFPQYSTTTTASVFEEANKVKDVSLSWITDYHRESAYIFALAESVRAYWQQHGKGQHLLLSFHSIPESYHQAGDPYYYQCQATVALLAKELNEPCRVVFQSRVGPSKWLEPDTAETLEALAKKGISRVDVLAPGFSTDCLETLEELAIRGKETFLEAGGKEFHYIPALNDSVWHIEMMKSIISCHAFR